MKKAASKSTKSKLPPRPQRASKVAVKALLKRRFVQPRPWRYIAICIVGGSATPDSTYVRPHDQVFWVNWDEREYTLTFLTESPFDNKPMTIVVPAKEPGLDGNFGVAGPFRVRNDVAKVKHQYLPTAANWSGPPDPPDVSAGD